MFKYDIYVRIDAYAHLGHYTCVVDNNGVCFEFCDNYNNLIRLKHETQQNNS